MADQTNYTPLPADLPEDWTPDQIVAPAGADVGLSEQHGYNYLMKQVNAAQRGVNGLQTAAEQLQSAVAALEEGKQDKLTGTKGQVVGFDGDGNAVAQEPPPSGFFPQIIVAVDAGAVVTCAQGTSSFRQTAGAEPVVFTVTEYGTWTLSAEKDGQPSNTVEVAVDAARQYHVELSFFAATITVTVEAGSTVTCAKGDSVQTAVSIGAVTFTVHEAGTYTITAVKGEDTAEQMVEITEDGQAEAVKLAYVKIFGVEWDWENGNSTKGIRTDDAVGFSDPSPAVNNGDGSSPFDDIMPWAGMVKEVRTGGVMVKEPKFWFKWTKTGENLKLQIANGPVGGFHVDPVNMDKGDGLGELDFSYIGRYHCADDNWKSETNKSIKVNIARSEARTSIHDLGSNIWQMDFAQMWYVGMLYLVEFADWNGQVTIGYGCSGGSSTLPDPGNNGETDVMQYHTGTTAANRTTYGYTQYRNIEGWWDNVFDWMDGCYYSGVILLNVILDPNKFSDTENGTPVGTMPSYGYPNKVTIATQSGFEWVLYPEKCSGSNSTYIPDYWSTSDTFTLLSHGSSTHKRLQYGPFGVNTSRPGFPSSNIGCRLQERPPKSE